MMTNLLPHYIITNISDPQGRGNASLLIVPTKKKIILEEIEVEAQYRGMKVGSQLLGQVCWLADTLGFTVVLVAVCLDVTHKGLSLEHLESWYERYGFSLQKNYEDGYPYRRFPQ